jgi:hypothetical protein
MQLKRLKVYPQYGYGWSPANTQAIRETPLPFSVRITEELPGAWNGVVEAPGHEFHGCDISMSQRYAEPEGTLSVTVDGKATGWASLVATNSQPTDV